MSILEAKNISECVLQLVERDRTLSAIYDEQLRKRPNDRGAALAAVIDGMKKIYGKEGFKKFIERCEALAFGYPGWSADDLEYFRCINFLLSKDQLASKIFYKVFDETRSLIAATKALDVIFEDFWTHYMKKYQRDCPRKISGKKTMDEMDKFLRERPDLIKQIDGDVPGEIGHRDLVGAVKRAMASSGLMAMSVDGDPETGSGHNEKFIEFQKCLIKEIEKYPCDKINEEDKCLLKIMREKVKESKDVVKGIVAVRTFLGEKEWNSQIASKCG